MVVLHAGRSRLFGKLALIIIVSGCFGETAVSPNGKSVGSLSCFSIHPKALYSVVKVRSESKQVSGNARFREGKVYRRPLPLMFLLARPVGLSKRYLIVKVQLWKWG